MASIFFFMYPMTITLPLPMFVFIGQFNNASMSYTIITARMQNDDEQEMCKWVKRAMIDHFTSKFCQKKNTEKNPFNRN